MITWSKGWSLESSVLIRFNERSKNHSETTKVTFIRAGSHGEYNFAP